MGIVQSWADILSVRTIPVACSRSHRNCRVVVGQLWGFVDIRRRVLLGASSVRAAVMMWVEREQGNYQVWKSSVFPVRSHLVGCKLRGWRDCGLGAWRVGRGCLFVVVPWSFSRDTPHDRGRRPELNANPVVPASPHCPTNASHASKIALNAGCRCASRMDCLFASSSSHSFHCDPAIFTQTTRALL